MNFSLQVNDESLDAETRRIATLLAWGPEQRILGVWYEC